MTFENLLILNMTELNTRNPERFLELIKKSRKGKFKVYIGMIAGVGKTYRMLEETKNLMLVGYNVIIGYVETHGRADTERLLEGLPMVPRKSIFYKGMEMEEMDSFDSLEQAMDLSHIVTLYQLWDNDIMW